MPHPFAVGQKVRVTNLAIASQPECQRRIFDLAGARGSGRMGAGNRASRTDGGLLGAGFLARKPVGAVPAQKPRLPASWLEIQPPEVRRRFVKLDSQLPSCRTLVPPPDQICVAGILVD